MMLLEYFDLVVGGLWCRWYGKFGRYVVWSVWGGFNCGVCWLVGVVLVSRRSGCNSRNCR